MLGVSGVFFDRDELFEILGLASDAIRNLKKYQEQGFYSFDRKIRRLEGIAEKIRRAKENDPA